jgi:hypothetical protein
MTFWVMHLNMSQIFVLSTMGFNNKRRRILSGILKFNLSLGKIATAKHYGGKKMLTKQISGIFCRKSLKNKAKNITESS